MKEHVLPCNTTEVEEVYHKMKQCKLETARNFPIPSSEVNLSQKEKTRGTKIRKSSSHHHRWRTAR